MSRSARARPHKIYQPGKRHMELIASVSRSSGVDKDGDALRDFKVQQEYREFIQEKLDKYREDYPRFSYASTKDDGKQKEAIQENLLILFRKLREGILSTKRADDFALEVYETSLYLSVIFDSPKQTTSILSHLLPNLYLKFPDLDSMPSRGSVRKTSLLSLLYNLIASYPSQSRYFEQINSLPPKFLPRNSKEYRWIAELSRCLRTRNYTRLESLTTKETIAEIIGTASLTPPSVKIPSESVQRSTKSVSSKNPKSQVDHETLELDTFVTLLSSIRSKTRSTTWTIIRSAYMELNLSVSSSTSEWLCRSLTLCPVDPGSEDSLKYDVDMLVLGWIDERAKLGEVKKKEGSNVDDIWKLLKLG
ncbi:hypothetical protein ABKN59_008477 [Abortiporus biennis]